MSYTDEDRLQATFWFLDIHDAEEPALERLQEWLRWMDESPAHRLAFAAVEGAWRQVGVAENASSASLGQRLPADEYDGSISVDAWLKGRDAMATASASRPLRSRVPDWSRSLRLTVAVAAAVVASVIAAVRYLPALHFDLAPESFTTSAGEQMQITLPDGSQVTMGPRSKLVVAFTRPSRDLRLERGEAFFSVHKDLVRPFRVHVLDNVVTAVGTQFDVRSTNDNVVVAVAEGMVRVSRAGGGLPANIANSLSRGGATSDGASIARLARGESLSFQSHRGEQAPAAAKITSIDPGRAAQWREGWLIYRDEPLRDVLADVARYSDRSIVVLSPEKLDNRFTGAVYKDSIVEWLHSLPNAFAVSIGENGSRIEVAPARGAAAVSE